MNCLLCSKVMQKTVAEQYLDSYACEHCGYRCTKHYAKELGEIVTLKNDGIHYGKYLIARNRAINYTMVSNNGEPCLLVNRYFSDDEYIRMCNRYKRLMVLA